MTIFVRLYLCALVQQVNAVNSGNNQADDQQFGQKQQANQK
ncbi:hypothetical protein [Lentilactobacillus parakefiri]|nr:hypothetical protein [Lentilactobacillus parakefiri]